MSGADVSRLGASLRETLDVLQRERDATPSDGQILQFVDRVNRQVKRERRRNRVAAAAAGLAMAAGIALFVLSTRPQPLGYVVEGTPFAAEGGGWLRARDNQALPLAFSDGSRVRLMPQTRARVAELTQDGASVTLETGRVHAAVVHRPRSAWSVAAGPYTVRVTGTQFEVTWDPEVEVLQVTVFEGAVEVTGPVLTGSQEVDTNKRLTVSLPARRAVISEASADAVHFEGAEKEEANAGTPETASAQEAVKEPNWKTLADQGQHSKAFERANRLGLDDLSKSLGAEDLLRLADVARMAGQPAKAEPLLQTVRRRFPQSKAAGIAAYTLGVSAFDQRRAYAEAAQWFAAYLKEQPGGALAQQALGRLMEAAERAGQKQRAKQAAQRYLKSYPQGPHRAEARRLTSEWRPSGI